MKKIKVGGVPEHFNYPWHVTINNGSFKKQGLDVAWTDYHGGTGEISEALNNEEIDIALMLTEGIVKEISDGSPFKIIQNYIASPLVWGIHVAANSSFHSINDLENTKAAISRYGSGSHLLAYVNAKNQGWETKDLQFEVVKDLSGAVEALPNNDAQYFMWEHFTTKPLVDNGIFRRVLDCPTPWPCFVIVVKESFLHENRNTLNRLLETLNLTTKAFKETPNLENILAEEYGQKPNDIKQWLELTEWGQKQISEEAIEITQQQLFDLDLINKKLSYENYIG